MCVVCFFFFKQKTAYEMVMSDWSSDVCSSDLAGTGPPAGWRSTSGRSRAPGPSGSEERRVGKECHHRVDLGGRRIIKKKKKILLDAARRRMREKRGDGEVQLVIDDLPVASRAAPFFFSSRRRHTRW